MAAAAAPAAAPSAQVVGNAFVHQYYHILHQSPESVYRFYQEGSKLGRPESLGDMDNVTTMQAINEKILSVNYSEFRAEIKTVDSQESLEGGVLVLVTGYLTGKDNVRRNFTQSFFLATQDKGYFVLNDIFRYVEVGDTKHELVNQGPANGEVIAPSPKQDAPPVQEEQPMERSVPPAEEEEEQIEEEVYDPSDHEEELAVEEETPVEEVIDEDPNKPLSTAADSSSTANSTITNINNSQEEAPKKSYASIVKVMKENSAPLSVPAPAPAPARPVHTNPERQTAAAPPPASAPEVPVISSNTTETSSVQEVEVDGHSIYIKSLPLNATPAQLEEEFKKFGTIKSGGIQVRSHKQQGFCFGFVEFEVASAVQSAIEASPMMISGRQVYVEEKLPAGTRISNRGRFLPGRGGFRNDGMRGRGNYGGGRVYGRGDYGNRVDFGGRGGGRGGPSNRGGDGGYQRVDSSIGSAGGRGNRSGPVALSTSPKSVDPRMPAPA